MNNKQLNNLVISYQNLSDEPSFSLVYEEVRRRWKKDNVLTSLSRRYGLDYSEVESLANEVMYDIVRNYDRSGDFYNFLSSRLSSRCIDMRRRLSYRQEREVSLQSSITEEDSLDNEVDNPIIDFLVAANAEDEAIENLQRKSDQRQLIAHLLAKAPEKNRQALNALVESNHVYLQAAKLIGVKPDTVKDRVRKIATYFDANRNGHYYDYFTVETEPA